MGLPADGTVMWTGESEGWDSVRLRRERGPGRVATFAGMLVAVLTAPAAMASAASAAPPAARTAPAAPAARPDLKLPFACRQTWQLQTYRGHAPDDKEIDMYRVDGNTLGSLVAASAAGTVTERFDPGGLEIDLGNGTAGSRSVCTWTAST